VSAGALTRGCKISRWELHSTQMWDPLAPTPHTAPAPPQSAAQEYLPPPLAHNYTPGPADAAQWTPPQEYQAWKKPLWYRHPSISPPSFITMVLLAYSATTPMPWLIRLIIFPASFNIFILARNLFRCPLSCPVVGSSSTIISGSMDNMEATASLCLWPRLSRCRSIDEVLLNIKMRAQIKGIIAEAGRMRPELVQADMVGQANNMFWLLMNELQDGDGAWIWVRCMAGGVGGMRGSFCNGDYLSYSKFH